MKRRKFLRGAALGAVAAGTTIAAPAVVRAQTTFNWRMNNWYPAGLPLYTTGPGSATDIAKRIEEASGGRLKIQLFNAGELVPPNESFDACSSGTVEMNIATPYFWTGKTFASQYFGAVPFGLNYQGVNGWFYSGGGLELFHEAYAKFNMIAFPCGSSGVQMTGWFKKPIEKLDDLKGLKMRIPGLAGRVYQSLGVDVRLLPAGEIFPALERGVIDAAEFVGPALDRRLGLHKAAKHYYTTGWHEPATTAELMINLGAWNKLPPDLKAIVQNVCLAANCLTEAWSQAANAEAMDDLVKNQGVIAKPLPDDVVAQLRAETAKVMEDAANKDPFTRKVHDSYMKYQATYNKWAGYSEAVYHSKIRAG